MVDVRFLLKFLDRDSVVKNLFIILLSALFPTLDIWLLVYLSSIIPEYHNVLLAAVSASGLIGFFICFFIIKTSLNEIKFMIKNGIYPEKQFNRLAGSFFTAILMAIPGIISTITALVFMIPAIRTAVGKKITKSLSKDIKEVYEYIKLYEIDI